jgi:hypothetical protein
MLINSKFLLHVDNKKWQAVTSGDAVLQKNQNKYLITVSNP